MIMSNDTRAKAIYKAVERAEKIDENDVKWLKWYEIQASEIEDNQDFAINEKWKQSAKPMFV